MIPRMQLYSADFQAAKILGIPITKGWRKELKRRQLTPGQADQVKLAVKERDMAVRLARLIKGAETGECPFKLHDEFEIAGELYFRLRMAGVNAKLEITVPSDLHESGIMRIDIGVIHGGRLLHAIECKQEGVCLGSQTKQARAYMALKKNFGIQIHFANKAAHIDKIVALLTAQ